MNPTISVSQYNYLMAKYRKHLANSKPPILRLGQMCCNEFHINDSELYYMDNELAGNYIWVNYVLITP